MNGYELVSQVINERVGIVKRIMANPKTVERAKNIAKKRKFNKDLKIIGGVAAGTGAVAAGRLAVDKHMTPKGD